MDVNQVVEVLGSVAGGVILLIAGWLAGTLRERSKYDNRMTVIETTQKLEKERHEREFAQILTSVSDIKRDIGGRLDKFEEEIGKLYTLFREQT